ncbi:hypothetical protein ACF0H5_015241 [Mactra antiquata]
METIFGARMYFSQRVYICSFIVLSSLLVVSGEMTPEYKTEPAINNRFKTLWDLYLLPRLELDLSNKVSDWLQESGDQDNSLSDNLSPYQYENDDDEQYQKVPTQSRLKRIGLAGLENIDMMQRILHQKNNRPRLPMSVSNMNHNRLQQLMLDNGKRRK